LKRLVEHLWMLVGMASACHTMHELRHKMARDQIKGMSDGKYSPVECVGTKQVVVTGDPDPKHISTSFVERANLTMRMHMRRFTRLTNGLSKKLENHAHMVSICTVWYN
jgi:IS1 family transposase